MAGHRRRGESATRCDPCGKALYLSRKDARVAGKRALPNTFVQEYPCPHRESGWHFGKPHFTRDQYRKMRNSASDDQDSGQGGEGGAVHARDLLSRPGRARPRGAGRQRHEGDGGPGGDEPPPAWSRQLD